MFQRTISVSVNGDVATIAVGSYSTEIPVADLFVRDSFSKAHMLQNMRLASVLANGPIPGTIEFLDAVNRTNRGMELADGRYYVVAVDANADGTYTVSYGRTANGAASYSDTFDPSELVEREEDPLAVIPLNIRSWLRVGGHTALTPQTLAALNATKFWA